MLATGMMGFPIRNTGKEMAGLSRSSGVRMAAVIRMLIDHCDALGRKTIASVCVVNDSPPVIYYVLAECDITAPASKSKRSQAGQERAAKRHQKNPPGEGQGTGCFDIA